MLFALQNKVLKENINGVERVIKGDIRWIIGTIIYSQDLSTRYNNTAGEILESIRNGSIIDDDGTIAIGATAIARLCKVFGIRDRTYGRVGCEFSFLLDDDMVIAKKVIDLVEDYMANERSPNHIPERLNYLKFKQDLMAKIVMEDEDETLFGKLFDEDTV